MPDALGEDDVDVETPYLVPTHLRTQDSFGVIPARTFYVEAGAALLGGSLAFGLGSGDLLPLVMAGGAAAAMLAASPFGLLIEPRAEHGLAHMSHHAVRSKTLTRAALEKWTPARVDGDLIRTGYKEECRAVLRLPTVNLEIATLARKRTARRQWGSLLDSTPHPLQLVIPGRPASTLPVIQALRQANRAEAWELSSYLSYHLHSEQMVDRDRLLVVPATDPAELRERVKDLTVAFTQIGLEPERIDDPEALRQTLAYCWGTRPMTETGLPNQVRVSATDVQVDDQWARAYSLGKLPPSVSTNWLRRIIDGEIPCDTAIDIEPADLELMKFRLGLKLNQLMASRSTVARETAVTQIKGLHLALEQRRVLPYRLRATFVVRGESKAELLDRSRQVERRVRSIGGKTHLLKWEQLEGLRQVVPIRVRPLPNREHLVETGTLARAVPLAQATLQMANGVPFGVAGNAPCTWTVWDPSNPAKHAGWYARTGGGKGMGARTYLSREYLAKGIRIFGIDQDEKEEWAGRFTWYCGGRTFRVEKLADLDHFAYQPDDGVVFFALAHCRQGDLAAAFSRIRNLTVEHTLAYPFPSFFVVDEATRIAQSDAADDLAEIATRGRHWGWSGQFITQLVTHWFATQTGRDIQNNLATKLYGSQESTQIDEVAEHVRWSAEERKLIEEAGIGQFLLVTGGKRVWVNLYGHLSAAEYAMSNTDPPEQPAELQLTSKKPQTSRWRVHRPGDAAPVANGSNGRVGVAV